MFFAVLLMFTLGVSIALEAVVFMCLWNLFISTLDAPTVGILHALGLSVSWTFLLYTTGARPGNKGFSDTVFGDVVAAVLVISAGYGLHLLM